MSKAKTTPASAPSTSDERTYGRVALSDLSDARITQRSVHAVAGERRHFARKDAETSATAVAGERRHFAHRDDETSTTAVAGERRHFDHGDNETGGPAVAG
ncbi:hypothetical protein PybrP1_011539 [[Pythium] brassicae (nom. inval.)]|nr:hypothetical protein PybrP1_011539 [[Pythium] brassicae (nom. inval.)]